jgi:glycerol-3-phosphate acyltransferase PlsY
LIGSVVATLAIGYVSGSLPFGLWLGRTFRGVDVRTLGSGNLGATNVFRSLGRGLGIATLALDMLKGALPVAILPHTPLGGSFPGGPAACAVVAGLAAVLGHMFTFLASFRGGKGVATTAGVVLALDPPAFAIAGAVFVVTVALSRYISLGSILGALAFVAMLALRARGADAPLTIGFGALVALLVIVRHAGNIRRLARGEEPRFTWSRSR